MKLSILLIASSFVIIAVAVIIYKLFLLIIIAAAVLGAIIIIIIFPSIQLQSFIRPILFLFVFFLSIFITALEPFFLFLVFLIPII
jgi:hypothetical protein